MVFYVEALPNSDLSGEDLLNVLRGSGLAQASGGIFCDYSQDQVIYRVINALKPGRFDWQQMPYQNYLEPF